MGSPQCPRLHDVPLMEPIVCKRVASDRLTGIAFLDEAVVIACQDGSISTWARPGMLVRINISCFLRFFCCCKGLLAKLEFLFQGAPFPVYMNPDGSTSMPSHGGGGGGGTIV